MRAVPPIVRQSLDLLSRGAQRRYWLAVLLQMSTSFLDLAGVLMFGLVGVLSAAAAQGQPPPQQLQAALDFAGLANFPPAKAALVLAGIGAGLLVSKSIVTLIISRKISNYLAHCSVAVSDRMSAEFLSLPVTRVQEHPSQWSGFALSRGINNAIVGILSTAMTMYVEIALLVALGAGLFLVDPMTTAMSLGFFGIVVIILNRSLSAWSKRSGKAMASTEILTISTIYDAVATYREITVADRRDYYTNRFNSLRKESAQAISDQQFIALVPRYGMEVALVAGAALLVVFVLMTQPIDAAVGSLALFLAAASRVTPSLMRLNSARLTLHGLEGLSASAYAMDDFLGDHRHEALLATSAADRRTEGTSVHAGPLSSPVSVVVKDVSLRYPGSAQLALDHVSFDLRAGGRLALVGPSGAGKSTLADVIMGVVRPTEGSVLLGGMAPLELAHWAPGSIAYVPQEVALVTGSVRDNVALGVDPDDIDDDQVLEALHKANLADFLRESREGLDTLVGERGVRLSGGQRQRLGIARALYRSPRLLVLDEATSALDAKTESLITQTVESLADDVTIVTIAHRLATIREADLVLYLEGGKVEARGTFNQVRNEVPRFDEQASLLGL